MPPVGSFATLSSVRSVVSVLCVIYAVWMFTLQKRNGEATTVNIVFLARPSLTRMIAYAHPPLTPNDHCSGPEVGFLFPQVMVAGGALSCQMCDMVDWCLPRTSEKPPKLPEQKSEGVQRISESADSFRKTGDKSGQRSGSCGFSSISSRFSWYGQLLLYRN